jgi:hypothetical protein
MIDTLLEVLAALLVLYVLIVVMLWVYARRHPEIVSMRDALRMVPDVLRLVRRLASDNSMPRGLRIRLLHLIPDFIPVLGYADDLIIIALVLRSVTRTAGTEALARHWPGSPEGLSLVTRLAKSN